MKNYIRLQASAWIDDNGKVHFTIDRSVSIVLKRNDPKSIEKMEKITEHVISRVTAELPMPETIE